jgi:hypothetical protein
MECVIAIGGQLETYKERAMPELKGRGCYVVMSDSCWDALQDIAREFGWTLKYKRLTAKQRGPAFYGQVIPEDNARALSKILYRVIHAIEVDCLSEPLAELAKKAWISNLRAVADLGFAGDFSVD